jgi:hypothetical protein
MSCNPRPQLSYTLETAISGNTWDGLTWQGSSDGTTFDDSVASVKFTVLDSEGVEVLALTDGSGVTINDAAAWDVTVDEISPLTLGADVYSYALEITDAGGTIRTWLAGTWRVVADAVS